MDIKLKTSKELANEANKIEYELHHEEPKRLTWWIKITDKFKGFYFKWRF